MFLAGAPVITVKLKKETILNNEVFCYLRYFYSFPAFFGKKFQLLTKRRQVLFVNMYLLFTLRNNK